MAAELRILLLGEPRVFVDGRPVALPAGRPAMLLVALALSAGRQLTQARLEECLWDAPPASAATNLRTHLTTVRHALGAARDRLERVGDTLTLQVENDALDVRAFESAVRSAGRHEREGRPRTAAEMLSGALALWTGPPASGVGRFGPVADRLEALEAQRFDVVERFASLCLEVDRPGSAVAHLERLVEEQPLREEAWALLVNAYADSGDRAGARTTGLRAGRILERELGRRSQRIDDLLRVVTRHLRSVGIADSRPGAGQELVGRTALLSEVASAARSGRPVLLWGAAGVGKSALARAMMRHRGGVTARREVYLDFCGHSSGISPLTCDEAVRAVLRGVDAADTPGSGADALDRLRRAVDREPTSIVLDNVRDAGQVRALLSAVGDARVVVTSRSPLPSLACTSFQVPPLETPDAVELLARLLGGRGTDRARLTVLADLCGRVPLALQIMGARASTHPTWTVDLMIDRLRDERRRLEELRCDDLDVQAGLEVATRQLTREPHGRDATRLLHRWGAARVQTMSVELAAALLDRPPPHAHAALDRLVEAGLATPTGTVWGLHDLVRLYAVARAPGDAGAMSVTRSYLLDTSRRARDLLRPDDFRQSDVFDLPHALVGLADGDHAVAWYEQERANLVGAARIAREQPGDEADLFASRLPAGVYPFLPMRGYYRELLEIADAGLLAAGRRRDASDEALALTYSAVARARTGERDRAVAMLWHALDVRRGLGDPQRTAVALDHLGTELALSGRAQEAVDAFAEALRLHRRGGASIALGVSLNNFADTLSGLGRHEEALEHLRESERLRAGFGDHLGASITRLTIGQVLVGLGRRDEAHLVVGEALTAARRVGNREGEWRALMARADLSAGSGRWDDARRDLAAALALSAATGDAPAMATVRDALDALG